MASQTSDIQLVQARSQGYDGGVNLREAISQLGPNELRRGENGVLDERGGFNKRLGCVSNGVIGTNGVVNSGFEVDASSWAINAWATLARSLVTSHAGVGAGLIAAKNWVTNGDFETDVSGWVANAGGAISRTIAQHQVGAASMQVITTATQWDGALGAYTAPTAGQPYQVSAWIKAPVGEQIQVGAWEYNASNGAVGSSGVIHVGTGSWVLVTSLQTSPAATMDHVRPAILHATGSVITYYVDDVRVAAGFAYFASPGADLGTGLNCGMVAGHTYTFTCWCYLPSSAGVAPGSVFLQIYDNAGGYNGATSNFMTALDTWQQLTVTKTIGLSATETFARVAVNVNPNTQAILYFDQAVITDNAFRVISAYTFYRGASAPQVLIHTNEGKVYYTNDASVQPTIWTQIATGLSTTAPMSWETFNSKVYFSNGVDAYASWDGTTYTTFGSAPKGKFLRLYKDTMFLSGVTGLVDRIYESAAGDPETWPAANWVDIAKGDGDTITALGSDGLVLCVWKRNRGMTIYDPVTLANRVVDFEKGAESHFGVLQFEGEIYYLSRRGVVKFDNSGPGRFVSQKLDPLFSPETLNLAALNTAWAYTYGNIIGWALPEVGQSMPTVQIEYYPRLGPISQFGTVGIGPWMFNRIPASVFTRVRSGQTEFLYGGASSANKFLYLNAPIGTDDGVTFTALMETGAYDFGAPTRTKYIRRLRFLGRGALTAQLIRNYKTDVYKTKNVDLSAGTDLWALTDLWGVGTWGPNSVFQEALWNPDAFGRFFQVRFSDNSTLINHKVIEVGSKEIAITTGEWAVYQIILEGEVLGIRDT